ncbi:MAG: hypothetical protein J5768_03915 [Spirochaetales bacterium]|nr:hypothetical protein [Spirochaetales bacterium]
MKTRRTLSAVLAVMIALAILVSCASTGKNNADTSKATKFKVGPVSVVDLHGTWYEMGRQFGDLMKDELHDIYDFLQTIIAANQGNSDKTDSIVEQQKTQTPYRICEFMKGAAETSGLTYDQIHMINAVERIGGLPHCSVAMAWGDYTDGSLVIGRNYDYADYFSQIADDVAVTVYHPADGALATATIGYVGEIYAVNAINEAGIFLELNNGKPSANIKSPNYRFTGTTMLFDIMFDADDLNDIDLFFNTTNSSSSSIINVADSQKGVSYEWCPIDVKHGESENPEGLLVSTNYFLNPEWDFPVPSDADSWNAISRRDNLLKLLEAKKGSVDVSVMQDIITTPLEDGGAMLDLTVYQLVVVPETFELWIRVIDADDDAWFSVDLLSLLK